MCIDDWILKLAPKVLNVTGICNGEEKNFFFMDGESRRFYDVDMLRECFSLHFPKPGEATKWQVYTTYVQFWIYIRIR